MKGKNRRTHHCVGIYSCAATGTKMPVAPSSSSHACMSTDPDKWLHSSEKEVEMFCRVP